MPISNNCSAECAPERGYEPPARGNALGNKGNRTDGIHRQGQMPEASDKGSQPYSRAYGYGEMAGIRLPPNNIACPWIGDIV